MDVARQCSIVAKNKYKVANFIYKVALNNRNVSNK